MTRLTQAEWELSRSMLQTVESIETVFSDLWAGDARSAGKHDLAALGRTLSAQSAAMTESINRLTGGDPEAAKLREALRELVSQCDGADPHTPYGRALTRARKALGGPMTGRAGPRLIHAQDEVTVCGAKPGTPRIAPWPDGDDAA